jgi:hypothetical protein
MNSNILPEDFDGVFRFTNFSDEDFVAKWDKVEYTFPANKTSPMVMNATPVEIQNIRKKFARELAEREFYKTPKFNKMNEHVPGGKPALYTDSDLQPFIQKCLEPLPIVHARTRVLPKDNLEDKNSKDEEGNPLTVPLDKKKSLIKDGSTTIND